MLLELTLNVQDKNSVFHEPLLEASWEKQSPVMANIITIGVTEEEKHDIVH